MTVKKIEAVQLIISSANGVYIPQNFAELSDDKWEGFDGIERGILQKGPKNALYWQTWVEVHDNAFRIDEHGNRFTLLQREDLFAVCWELMTPEEKEVFEID